MPEFQFSSEELESRLQNVLRALHPRQLLENVCGPAFERPGTRDFRIGLGGGYSDGWGQRHAEANAWPVLRAFFENDPRMRSALRGAESLGLHGRFGGDQEHNMHVFQYIFDVDDNACVFIRRRAFQNKIHFPGDETA